MIGMFADVRHRLSRSIWPELDIGFRLSPYRVVNSQTFVELNACEHPRQEFVKNPTGDSKK